jgi:hypothetical protein
MVGVSPFKGRLMDEILDAEYKVVEQSNRAATRTHIFGPQLPQQLKAAGYKVVHMVPKGQVTTIPKYDEMVTRQDKLSSNNTRPENSVVRTIGE